MCIFIISYFRTSFVHTAKYNSFSDKYSIVLEFDSTIYDFSFFNSNAVSFLFVFQHIILPLIKLK